MDNFIGAVDLLKMPSTSDPCLPRKRVTGTCGDGDRRSELGRSSNSMDQPFWSGRIGKISANDDVDSALLRSGQYRASGALRIGEITQISCDAKRAWPSSIYPENYLNPNVADIALEVEFSGTGAPQRHCRLRILFTRSHRNSEFEESEPKANFPKVFL